MADDKISGFLTLKPISLGLGFAVSAAVFFIAIAIAGMLGYAEQFITIMSGMFIGYKASFTGSLIGGAWGLGFGFIFGYIIAMIHNKIL